MKKALTTLGWVLLGVFVLFTFYFLWKQAQPAAVVYDLVTPAERDIVTKTVATGSLQSRTQVELKPQITGIITEIRVQAGDPVKKGDVVAIIRVIPDMGMLNQAQSEVEASKIALAEVKREVDRSKRLFQKGVISQEENEKEENRLAAANEKLQAALSQVEVITKGSSKRAGTVNTTEVRSSMTGIILSVPVKVGVSVSGSSAFSQGTTIATVADMNDIIFDGNIDETEVAKLHKGMSMSLIPGAMQGVQIPAVLDYIAPEGVLQNGSKMFELKATATIPENFEVRSGYSVNAHIILNKAEKVMSIDETCVEHEKSKTYVYRLTSHPNDLENQEWERIEVGLGISDGIYVEVKSGIQPTDKIKGIRK